MPIAYVLILAPIFLAISRYKKIYLFGITVLYLVLYFSDVDLGYNLSCLLIGIGGIAVGSVFDSVKEIFSKTYFRIFSVALLLGLFLILIPSGFNIRANILVALIYILIITANLYLLGSILNTKKYLAGKICDIGKYSLLLYLVQVVLLRFSRIFIKMKWEVIGVEFWSIVLACIISMIVIVDVVIYLRKKNVFCDKCYRLIFS